MDRWVNKVAVVTGASSGIGAAVVKDLVKAGLIVVGLARRDQMVREIRDALPENLQSNLHPIKCDVSKEDEVKSAFNWIEVNLGGVDILVNCAGIIQFGLNLTDANNTQSIREIVDTNVMGVVYCARIAFNSMKKRKIGGHIVIVNSIFGHKVPAIPGMLMNIYPATKYAVTAMTETYRQEFINAGTKVKITSISPGAVRTEMLPEHMKNSGSALLNPEDVSNAILYVIGTPPHVQVHELIIKPMGETV